MCENSSCKIEKKHCEVVVVVNCNNIVICSSNKGILNSFYNNTKIDKSKGKMPVFENADIITYLDVVVGILPNNN